MIKLITLTGADDTVTPNELLAISREFPFVEWGILVSSFDDRDRDTRRRFPSKTWLRELVDLQLSVMRSGQPRMNLSLHICGDFLRQIAAGASTLQTAIHNLKVFDRCQLNWHGITQERRAHPNILAAFINLIPWKPQVICQLDGVNDWIPAALVHSGMKIAGLYDQSHGTGVAPKTWPNCETRFPCGWSGGIGPENAFDVYTQHLLRHPNNRPEWLDMETNIRTEFGTHHNDYFDLVKCREVLTPIARVLPNVT